MSNAEARAHAVENTMSRIREIAAGRGITRDSLEEIAGELRQLATRADLFPEDEFPASRPGGTTRSRYLLHKQPDDSFALYLNSIHPGRNSVPHNHGTWAVIVAIDGDELNRVYRRIDDLSDPAQGRLEQVREITVRPQGDHIALLGDDIHSIHVQGSVSTRHFHLYGRTVESLTERVGYDLATGRIFNYNTEQFVSGRDARAA